MESGLNLSGIGPGDYGTLSKNADVIVKLDRVIEIWCKQIEQVRNSVEKT